MIIIINLVFPFNVTIQGFYKNCGNLKLIYVEF